MAGVVDAILAVTDPVNALLLAVMWFRLEQLQGRIRRTENELMENTA